MKTLFIEKESAYDGSQLHSLFAYLGHGVLGDSIVSWIGPCDIPFEHMIDGEDLREASAIRGARMLHFIVERFVPDLFAAVALQRLLAAIAMDLLRELIESQARSEDGQEIGRHHIVRDGDDIFIDGRKLSISIATVSPVSALVHFAVNCVNDGTPVPTAALADFGLAPPEFARDLMARFAREVVTIHEATCKVRWAK